MKKRKTKKYKVWTHLDTGVEQTIRAEDETTAIEKAIAILENKDFSEQIKNNMQVGETYIKE